MEYSDLEVGQTIQWTQAHKFESDQYPAYTVIAEVTELNSGYYKLKCKTLETRNAVGKLVSNICEKPSFRKKTSFARMSIYYKGDEYGIF